MYGKDGNNKLMYGIQHATAYIEMQHLTKNKSLNKNQQMRFFKETKPKQQQNR
jgi:hypothetical protein